MIRFTNLLCLFGALLPALAWSQDAAEAEAEAEALRYYDVEIVIFRNINVPRGHEYNLPTPLTVKPHSSLDLFDPASVEQAAEAGYTPLTPEEMRLHDIVQSITRSSRYGLMLHTGWRQPGLAEEETLPVWIRGGELFDESYQSIDQAMFRPPGELQPPIDGQDLAAVNPATEMMDSATLVQKPLDGLYELEGQVTIVLSRYLHTHANLVFRKPASPHALANDAQTEGGQAARHSSSNLLLNYALNEKRRMRSKRLHYLDHPQFGMLVLITPYEAPEPSSLDSANPNDPQSTSPGANDAGAIPAETP